MTVEPAQPRSEPRGAWRPPATLPAELWDKRSRFAQTSDPVLYLHRRWDLSHTTDSIPPAGSPAKTAIRKFAWRVIRPCLDRYFKEEHDLVANLVRAVDLLAKHVDDLASNALAVATSSRIAMARTAAA